MQANSCCNKSASADQVTFGADQIRQDSIRLLWIRNSDPKKSIKFGRMLCVGIRHSFEKHPIPVAARHTESHVACAGQTGPYKRSGGRPLEALASCILCECDAVQSERVHFELSGRACWVSGGSDARQLIKTLCWTWGLLAQRFSVCVLQCFKFGRSALF